MEAQTKGVRVRDCSLAIVLAWAVASLIVTWSAAAVAASAGGPGDAVASEKVKSTLDKVPLGFEANQGQTDRRVRFLSRGHGYALFLTGNQAVLSLRAADQPKKSTSTSGIAALTNATYNNGHWNALRVRLEGANRNPAVTAIDQLPGHANYLIGRDHRNWRTNIRTYEKVKYTNVYPGIDLVYHGSSQRQLEYDFVVGAGRDPGVIDLAFAGMDRIELNSHGDLVIKMGGREILEHAPVIYQEIDGRKRRVSGSYLLKRKDRVSFKLAAYDRNRPLVIDPTLTYSTYLGGSGQDQADAIAIDRLGNVYVAGFTISPQFPITDGAYQTTSGGNYDVFVTKFNASDNQIVYSTYLGGRSTDTLTATAVDQSGNAYVTGYTASFNFPTTADAFQRKHRGDLADAFVAKLNNDGSELVYSTYLGGGGFDFARGIAVDQLGEAYVSGETFSKDFPTTAGAWQTRFGGGDRDAFVTKLNADGSGLVYSSYLGGSDSDSATALSVDRLGNAYLTGFTGSGDFPTTPGAYQPAMRRGFDIFVTKVDAAGNHLAYSTYLGGDDNDSASAIAVDLQGDAYVTGATSSTNFPTTPQAYLRTNQGVIDAYVAKLSPEGSQLVYSTYLGGSFLEGGNAIALDRYGNAYVAGQTLSTDFPTTPDAYRPVSGGSYDGFVSELSASGGRLFYSTYLGGADYDVARGIAADQSGNMYVTGDTESANFPLTPDAYQKSYGGRDDAFVTKFQFEPRIIGTPGDGSSVSGAVAIQTQRNSGVKWLNVYVDGTYLASSPPFDFSWDSSNYAGGEHHISAVAYGYDDQVVGNDEVTVKVINPAVKIDAPGQSSTVSGMVTIDTERTQEIDWLNVYIDDHYLASSPPFSFQWNSSTVPDGAHLISAKGYGASGTEVGATSVIVYTNNSIEKSVWPMQGHDRQRTGQSPIDTSGTRGKLAWRYSATAHHRFASSAIASDGTIYAGSEVDGLIALSPDGIKKWQFVGQYSPPDRPDPVVDSGFFSPVVAPNGTIYVGSIDFTAYSILPDGVENWAFFAVDGGSVASSIVGIDGTVYFGAGFLYALYPDGTKKWEFTGDDGLFFSLAIGRDGTLYAGSFQNDLLAITPEGSVKWRFQTSSIQSSPAIGSDGTIYVTDGEGHLYAINPDGTERWRFAMRGAGVSSPAIGSDSTIYVGSLGGILYALNPDGREKWEFCAAGPVESSPAIGAEGTVYFGIVGSGGPPGDGTFYAVRPDGLEKWRFTTDGGVLGSPAIGPDATIYVGSQNGKLYAIR